MDCSELTPGISIPNGRKGLRFRRCVVLSNGNNGVGLLLGVRKYFEFVGYVRLREIRYPETELWRKVLVTEMYVSFSKKLLKLIITG